MRNYAKLLILALLFMILLGCMDRTDLQDDQPKDIPSSQSLQIDKTKEVLSGKSLENAQYTIDIPEDILLEDDHLLSDSYSFITVTSDDYDFVPYSLNGDYTILNLHFSYINGTEQIPIMYLQAFDTANYDGSKFIKINNKIYDISLLESNIVYQDSNMIIYNFYPYIEEMSFQDFLKQSINDINKASYNETDWPKDRKNIMLNFDDYQYLLDAETYINQNISSFITPINNYSTEESSDSVQSKEAKERNLEKNQNFEIESSNQTASLDRSLTTQNEKPSELSSSKKDESTTKSRHINYLGQMFGYLKKNLDRNHPIH